MPHGLFRALHSHNPLVSYIYKNTMYISYMVNFLFVHILSMLIRLSMALKLP